MSTSFSNALSGLKANAFAIDVVSGNLANLNTTAYKEGSVSFQNLVNDLASGGGGGATVGGSTIAVANRSFSQGSPQSTNQPFDAAIQGNGFFVLRSKAEQVFSRAGNFKVDASGHLLTQQNQNVQGWNAANGVLNTTSGVSDITVPNSSLRQPSPTSHFTITANMNASSVVGSADATFSTPIPIVDSLGISHVVTVTYVKSAASTWGYSVTVPSSAVTGGVGATTTLASGTLTFDGSGHLATPLATAGPIAVPITGLADGATDMAMTWSLYDANGDPTITQYSQTSANLGSTQDGTPSGQLTSISIGPNGQILARYSNGDAVAVAQLALASILNPDSMQDLGQNTFGVTSLSSIPAIGMPGTGSRGAITGGALEASTVDIAKEFTNLLTYERAYQAASKVVTTEDDILQETVALKR
jgi:flagellar hook protein FlgE